MSEAGRLAALERAGLVHPRPEAVTAPLFSSGGFFLAADKVQVKYEMLRAHLADHVPVTAAAAAHGYSRAAFYLAAASFEQAGMAGLLDERRGRRGPVKLRRGDRRVHPLGAARIRGGAGRAGGGPVRGGAAPPHHRAGAGPVSARVFWPPAEAAQADYEMLRALRTGGRRPARRAGRRPVRPPRAGRADRLARGRAGLPRRACRRGPPAVDPARRPARPGAGGRLPVPARRGRTRWPRRPAR